MPSMYNTHDCCMAQVIKDLQEPSAELGALY